MPKDIQLCWDLHTKPDQHQCCERLQHTQQKHLLFWQLSSDFWRTWSLAKRTGQQWGGKRVPPMVLNCPELSLTFSQEVKMVLKICKENNALNLPAQTRTSHLPLDCPKTSPCNTSRCCCSHLHRRDCPISQVSTCRDTFTSELHSGVVVPGHRAGVTDTSSYWRELAALPGWKLRGLQQVEVGLSLLWERAGIQCAGGKYGIRLPDGTAHRIWTKSNASSQKHANRRGVVATIWTQFCCHPYIWPADDTLPNQA